MFSCKWSVAFGTRERERKHVEENKRQGNSSNSSFFFIRWRKLLSIMIIRIEMRGKKFLACSYFHLKKKKSFKRKLDTLTSLLLFIRRSRQKRSSYLSSAEKEEEKLFFDSSRNKNDNMIMCLLLAKRMSVCLSFSHSSAFQRHNFPSAHIETFKKNWKKSFDEEKEKKRICEAMKMTFLA